MDPMMALWIKRSPLFIDKSIQRAPATYMVVVVVLWSVDAGNGGVGRPYRIMHLPPILPACSKVHHGPTQLYHHRIL